MTGAAIRKAMAFAGGEGFDDAEAEGEAELTLLLDVVDAARFFAEEYPEVPEYDLPSENQAIRDALAALDEAT